MTQAHTNKTGPSIGTAAAQAAAGQSAAKPVAATAPAPADKPAASVDADATDATDVSTDQATTGKKRTPKRKIFVVVGPVLEFESIVQAEKHLNGPDAPAGEYAVLHGTRSRTSKRVSLR